MSLKTLREDVRYRNTVAYMLREGVKQEIVELEVYGVGTKKCMNIKILGTNLWDKLC